MAEPAGGPRRLLVRGHTLVAQGYVASAQAHSPAASGPGKSKCTCGTWSPRLPNAVARRRWHREHKLEVLAKLERKRQSLQAAIDAEMPPAGPCGFCGGPDKRHRVLDAAVGCVRGGDSLEATAEAYGLSIGLVRRLAEDWAPTGEQRRG